jgi:hypothetical protein
MKGSDFMRRLIAATETIQAETIQATAARARQATGVRNRSGGQRDGEQVARLAHQQREQLLRLSEIRIELEASRQRNTVDAALRELAHLTFRRTPQQRPQQRPQRMPQQAPQARRGDDDVSLYTTRRRGR